MRWRAESSNSSEAGTQVALRSESPTAHETRRVGLRERGRLRRRVRFLRKRRELELRELGGLIFDMYRFGSKRQDLVRDKLQEMFAADRELREFEHLLGRRQRHVDVREAGVGGSCPRCQQLYSSEARFCSRCGQILSDGTQPDVVMQPSTVPEHEPYHPPTPEPVPEPQTQAWQSAEPQTEAWQSAEPEPEQEPPTWQGGKPQPRRWQGPAPDAGATEPAPQAAESESQADEPEDGGGARRGFRRRPRTTPSPAASTPPEIQAPDWQARSRAALEARRRAWQTELPTTSADAEPAHQSAWDTATQASPAEPVAEGVEDEQGDPAAPAEGGADGLEADGPLAWRPGRRQQ